MRQMRSSAVFVAAMRGVMLMHHHAQMGSQAQVVALKLRDDGLTFAEIGAELG